MKIFIADECNSAWDEKLDFFLFGGIVVCEDEIRILAEQLIQLKESAGIKKERPIKWTNNKWTNKKGVREEELDEKLHLAIKKQILDIVASSKSKIIVCLSPQIFYHKPKMKVEKVVMAINPDTQKRTHEYGLNDALKKFDSFLSETNDLGIVFVDKFGDSVKEHMSNHCVEIFPYSSKLSTKRIVHPIVQLTNEESYLHQINDVVLGAVYFSLREVGFNFLPIIRDNFWKDSEDSSLIGKGFNIYPAISRYEHISVAKRNLSDKFLRAINSNV